MTTQTIPPESVSARDWQQIFAQSAPGESGSPEESKALVRGQHSFDDFDSEDIREILGHIVVEVLKTNSDDRLDYLRSVNPDLTEEHLETIATTTERWLNDKARERIRNIAHCTYENQIHPRHMVINWSTAEEVNRLVALLLETSIPDKTLATCYAMSIAYDTAYAAYFIHKNRIERPVNFADVEQTPEEVAGDLRFVNIY